MISLEKMIKRRMIILKINNVSELKKIANDVRIGIIEEVYNAQSGHPGGRGDKPGQCAPGVRRRGQCDCGGIRCIRPGSGGTHQGIFGDI